MTIWYHGTTKENAEEIAQTGFREGTFFTSDLSSAIFYGGEFVFHVWFDEDPTSYWEYVATGVISTEKILYLIYYSPELCIHNRECQRRIREQSIKEEYIDGVTICEDCDGRGQEEEYYPLTTSRKDYQITSCKSCKGFGRIPPVGKSIHDCRKG